MIESKDWYIEYDHKTFQALNDIDLGESLFNVAEMFAQFKGPISDDTNAIPQWIQAISQAGKQITTLLFNFFYVEEKLTANANLKTVFFKIYKVLQIQNQYTNFFFVLSENFREYRITAHYIRLNRFLEKTFKTLQQVQKDLDQTFLENLDQVCLFMQQKIKETLEKTASKNDHWLNIIQLDILSMLLRHSGDPTMRKILDKNNETKLLDNIEKSNEIYEQFNRKKEAQMINFSLNQRYVSTKTQVQEDSMFNEEKNQNDDSDYA